MINVCHRCGEYHADKIIDPAGPYAICPACGFQQPFLYLPLLVIGGASGSGKSAVCNALTGKLPEVVTLDSDILWRAEFNKPEENYRDYFELWLRLCKNINQSGRPVVLFGAGMGVPENLESCVERRYFSTVAYLALTCTDAELARRLQDRLAWRGSHEPQFIEGQVAFNRWFRERDCNARPPIHLLDTSGVTLEDTLRQVTRWIHQQLAASPTL